MSDSPAGQETPLRFREHELRSVALGEIHARPFTLTEAPRIFLHYAFLSGSRDVDAERAWLVSLCEARGKPGPSESSRFHLVSFANGLLRWERHSEFSTFTFDAPLDPSTAPFAGPVTDHPFGEAFQAPGPMIVAVRLELRAGDPETEQAGHRTFDAASLCVSRVEDGAGRIVTDFKQDGDGRTRILALDDGMSAQAAGAVVQRLLEIETYRTLALLGLPEAHALSPQIAEIEEQLTDISGKIPESHTISGNKDLLHILSSLAARVEALAAKTAFRFGATRAYHSIVVQRMGVIDEGAAPGAMTWTAFLTRRLNPAMRTCQASQDRLEELSRRLSRAADLLRTRVDVELEQQNRDLLQSMNRRARLQLRLQQTVEGLSVAAVSYYVVGLIGYAVKGAGAAGLPVNDKIATALSVPIVCLAIWWIVRRIRRSHDG